jgi:hypothetical protein
VPSRRLDDRIRELCTAITRTPDAEVEPLLRELQSAIREKIEAVRKIASEQLLQKKSRKERRDE